MGSQGTGLSLPLVGTRQDVAGLGGRGKGPAGGGNPALGCAPTGVMPHVPCRNPKGFPVGRSRSLRVGSSWPGRDAQIPLKYLGILLIIKGQTELAGDLVSSHEAEEANVVRRKMVR